LKTIAFGFSLCTAITLISPTAVSQADNSSRPHVARQGKNLIANPSLDTTANWSYLRDAEYDDSTSRAADGSGSMKLRTPLPKSSMVVSKLIAVRPAQQYTYSFYFKTQNGPTYVGAQISLHDNEGKYIRNHTSGLGGTTSDEKWQEFALPFIVPEGVAFIGCQAYKGDNTGPNGIVWADDFYLGEGLGLEQPPEPKKPFDGAHVRIDGLGNFEVKQKDVWTPFFPLCMYSDNYRDWSVYSRQGWNTIIWTGAAHQVKQAKDAVSDFNPAGMMAGFQISQYTFPAGWAYNDLDDLRTKLNEIFEQGLGGNLLLYYWDNENNHDQWQVPVAVINTIKSVDVDSSGKRLHPIYALQGTYNNARVHAARGLVDVSGTYFGGNGADTGDAGQGGHEGLFLLDRHEGQSSPAAIAQFNGVDGPGDMRLRLYNSIILGAKAMGYWRDCFPPRCPKVTPTDGPVDAQPWWPDFPNLRREVDRLLPIIREPHWTAWKVDVDPPGNVRVGTRNHKGEAYLIFVNQTITPQTATVRINDLPYKAKEVRDALDNEKLAAISDSSFSITLPGIGIGSGTKIARLVSATQDPCHIRCRECLINGTDADEQLRRRSRIGKT